MFALLMFISVLPIGDHSESFEAKEELRSKLCAHEIAVAGGFIAFPIVAVAIAVFITGAFTYRYALPAVIGFSILLPFAVVKMHTARALVLVVLTLALCASFAVLNVRRLQTILSSLQEESKTHGFLRSTTQVPLPIVVSEAHTFMKLAHYAPTDIASRLVYLADPDLALRQLGQTTVDRGLLALSSVFRANVQTYDAFIDSQERFFIYGPNGNSSWLLSELPTTEMRIELKGRNKDNLLFLVSHTVGQ
jgi:hypothetical protein